MFFFDSQCITSAVSVVMLHATSKLCSTVPKFSNRIEVRVRVRLGWKFANHACAISEPCRLTNHKKMVMSLAMLMKLKCIGKANSTFKRPKMSIFWGNGVKM